MYLRVFSHLLLHIDRSPSPLYGRISGDRQHEHSDPVLLGPEGAGCAGRASGVDLRPRVEAGRLEGYAGGEKPPGVVRKHAGDMSLGDRHLRDDGAPLLLLHQDRRAGRTVREGRR